MDEQKKSGSSWKEAERLGPYQIHEQVPQSAYSQEELYRATHAKNGAAVLVLKPSDEDGAVPLTDWRVRLISSASPRYVAMEVEHTPRSVAPDKHSMEALVFTLEDVREGVRRMDHALSDSPAPRSRRRLGLALASAVAVGALVCALVRLTPVSQPTGGPSSLAGTEPAPPSHEVLTDTAVPLTGNSSPRGTADGGPPVLAHPFPRKPYKGQKRPPCTPRVEVEIMGACWVPHELKAPCPEELYEYQGKCYTTSMLPQPMPQSLGQ